MLISVVYDSDSGHTAKQVQAVADGIQCFANADAKLIEVGSQPTPWDTLEAIGTGISFSRLRMT